MEQIEKTCFGATLKSMNQIQTPVFESTKIGESYQKCSFF